MHKHGLKWVHKYIEKTLTQLEKLLEGTMNVSIDDIKTEIKLHQQFRNSNNLPIPTYKYVTLKQTSN